jgi:hypothetical protein
LSKSLKRLFELQVNILSIHPASQLFTLHSFIPKLVRILYGQPVVGGPNAWECYIIFP